MSRRPRTVRTYSKGLDTANRLICVSTTPAIDRFGEVEAVRLGAIHRPTNLVAHPGGKGLNAARAAAHLGAPVTAIALLAGHAGRWISERLPSYGIEAHVAWAAGETRSCLSIYDHATQQLTEFYEPAGAVTAQEWSGLEAVLASTLEQAGTNDLLVLSGTQPPGAPSNSHGRLVALARAQVVRTIVHGYGRALHDALAEGAWGIKINAAEAAAVTGMTISDGHSALAAAMRLRDLGAQAVVITLGLQGAVATGESGRAWAVGRVPAEGRYPVGSGDVGQRDPQPSRARGPTTCRARPMLYTWPMKRLNWVLSVASLNVLLVTVERVSPTTAVLFAPHHFLRLHELLQITTLILLTVILPLFVLQIVTQNFRALQTRGGFALFVVFISGVYFYATGNGLHEVSSFNFSQFCARTQATTDLCGGFFINDYYTGNILYFIGGALMVITPLLFEALLPQEAFGRRDIAILYGNACVYALAIFAYAAFDPVLVGLVYALGIALVADGLWLRVRAQYRAHPVTTYTAVAYSVGALAALTVHLR